MRTRSRRLVTPAIAVAALALAALSASAATSPGALVDCGTAISAQWRQGADSSTKWVVLATRNLRCVAARSWVADLAPKAASSGTVDVVRFAGGDGWACLAGRSLLLGMCTSRDPAGTGNRVVMVIAASRANEFLIEGLASGSPSAAAALTGLTGSGGSTGGLTVSALRGRTGRAPTACVVTTGPAWRMGPRSGTQWRVYAGGGLTCLAAQGWLADLGSRLARHAGGAPAAFDGGDGWRCVVGKDAAVGACARGRTPREQGGDVELKYVVVAPVGADEAVLRRIASHGYDAGIRTLFYPSARVGSFERCGSWKGVSWRASSATGNRWRLGVAGGYPCASALASAPTLAGWSVADTGTRDVGVRGAWSCRSTAASLQTVCTWDGPSPSDGRTHAKLRIALVADRTGSADALATLLGGSG